MLIDQNAIAGLLPHTGDMCLLDAVESWDAARITCLASSHRSPSNPLRRNGAVGILCGIEYAAQAMAVHAALSAPRSGRPGPGYLAALRSVAFHRDRLDEVAGLLTIEATCLHREASRAIYSFAIRAADHSLLAGRAVVVVASGAPVVVASGTP